MSKYPSVAILGSGPSAAFAILACRALGIEPEVISMQEGHSQQSGAFFLHWLPPDFIQTHGISPIDVEFVGLGTAEGYSTKQWGCVIPTSFPKEDAIVKMYSSAELSRVWSSLRVKIGAIARDDIDEAVKLWDFVFHSFPIHTNGRQPVMFPVLDGKVQHLTSNRVLYNGHPDEAWVRCTIAFGRISYEYMKDTPRDITAPIVRKGGFSRHQLRDIHPDTLPIGKEEWLYPNLIPIGRFATYNRKLLSHDAYNIVVSTLKEGGVDAV